MLANGWPNLPSGVEGAENPSLGATGNGNGGGKGKAGAKTTPKNKGKKAQTAVKETSASSDGDKGKAQDAATPAPTPKSIRLYMTKPVKPAAKPKAKEADTVDGVEIKKEPSEGHFTPDSHTSNTSPAAAAQPTTPQSAKNPGPKPLGRSQAVESTPEPAVKGGKKRKSDESGIGASAGEGEKGAADGDADVAPAPKFRKRMSTGGKKPLKGRRARRFMAVNDVEESDIEAEAKPEKGVEETTKEAGKETAMEVDGKGTEEGAMEADKEGTGADAEEAEVESEVEDNEVYDFTDEDDSA